MNKKWVTVGTVLGLLAIVFGVYQYFALRKAHSTFENYYAFRGCTALLEKNDTYAVCKLPSGNTIKLVKINDAWYLDGDGPGVW